MTRIPTYSLKHFANYIEKLEELRTSAKAPLWFRGAGRMSNDLTPTLFRHPNADTSGGFRKLENDLMTRFRHRSPPYHSRNLSDPWEAIFFMQHYGVPTRLLDWTENPFVALFFALMTPPSEIQKNGKRKYLEPACVWVLNPAIWNRTALKHVSFKGGALTPGDDAIRGYSPEGTSLTMHTAPVAIFGAHNSARIVAQQGVFTIFGSQNKSMQNLVTSGEFPKAALQCISIPPSKIRQLGQSLLDYGITESTIYPDLEGLAREIKRHFGFEV